MQRIHEMPFGAQILPRGGVRFALWAPAARSVALALEDGKRSEPLAMAPGEPGWFALEVGAAGPDSRYRFVIDGDMRVPDPASRSQPDDVHGASAVVDPRAFRWDDGAWQGRPWEEAVLYELHVGTFTPEGTFRAAAGRLDDLAALGVTALELMPVADWPGARNWGYDGCYPFAPDARYGRADDLKALVQAAHARSLMVLLDVVYNHFGPEGNYLHRYAPQFFTDRYATPWGAAIDFDGRHSRTVREFFIENALFWLEEYNFDGLRLDAVHAIWDQSHPDFLSDLARRVHAHTAAGRHRHLVLENDRNEARYLQRGAGDGVSGYTAQWNDDAHHALHVLITGEDGGYFRDYADAPNRHLGRCLTEGFAFQGEPSPYRGGAHRGEPSANLPPTAFIGFLQNHDQVGNRAFGERITEIAPAEAVRAATAVVLLAPSPPLLFMGQEWAATSRFPFFCDFGPDLADSVRDGRRREFANFPRFRDAAARAAIPDPTESETFAAAVLDWSERDVAPHDEWLAFHRRLLALRLREIVPRLPGTAGGQAEFETIGSRALRARWTLGDGAVLHLTANLAAAAARRPASEPPAGRLLFASDAAWRGNAAAAAALPPWFVSWHLEAPPEPKR